VADFHAIIERSPDVGQVGPLMPTVWG